MAVTQERVQSGAEPARTGLSVPALQQAVLDNLMR